MIETHRHAIDAVIAAWPEMLTECASVLGSELHYQAMIYHSLRSTGVPLSQIGMNVKMWISDTISPLFKELDQKKNVKFQGGFEPIPDVVIFDPLIQGDWRRRNRKQTLIRSLVAMEVKASERYKGRLRPQEIVFDIDKLAAHRSEAVYRGGGFAPIMIIVDTAPEPVERMRPNALEVVKKHASVNKIGLIYIGGDCQFALLENISWE
jgi:hypothetical protein